MAETVYRNLANRDAGKKTNNPAAQYPAWQQRRRPAEHQRHQMEKPGGKKSINEEKTSSFIRPQHVKRLSPTVTRRSLAHKLS